MSCMPIQDCYLQARKSYLQQGSQEALSLLQRLLDQRPGPPWEGRVHLLLARALEASGDPAAIGHYQGAMKELPEVGDYILFSLGQLYLKQSQSLKAAEVFEALHQQHPDSLLRPLALFQAAQAYTEAGQNASAIAAFETFLSLYPDDPNAVTALYKMGQVYLKEHQTARAVELFKRVVWQFPQETVAASAQSELENLSSQGVPVPPLTPEEKLQQARALYRAARYPEAARIFRETLESPSTPSMEIESKLYLGISLVRARQWPEALRVLEDLLKSRPEGETAGEALTWFGRAALRLDDLDRLRQMLKILNTTYPERSERARALWFLAIYYEGKKQDQKAIEACLDLIRSFPQDSLAPEAYWRIGWIHYKNGRTQEAVKAFDEFLGKYTGSAFRPQVLFWKARLLGHQEREQAAIEVSRQLCMEHTRTYYCHRARQIWNLTPSLPDSPIDLEAFQPLQRNWHGPQGQVKAMLYNGIVPDGISNDRRYRKAEELTWVALPQEAAQELSQLVERYTSNREALLFLVDRLYALGAFDQGLRIIQSYFPEILEKGGPEVPDHLWEKAYPLGIVERINGVADAEGLDPFLVAAIIREESGYNAKAVSRAGAVGLMQIMPETGRWIASQLGLQDFRPEHLYGHDLNIRMGSWYLSHLMREFNRNLVLAIAAYNAGPEAVAEWVKRDNYQDMDEFIEQIPYSETRSYVKRVLRSYYEYRALRPSRSAQFLDKESYPEYS